MENCEVLNGGSEENLAGVYLNVKCRVKTKNFTTLFLVLVQFIVAAVVFMVNMSINILNFFSTCYNFLVTGLVS